jgi:hypothetical protein
VRNREQWLSEAVQELTPLLNHHKLQLAPSVRVSCGFPSKGGASSSERRVTGETWPSAATFDASVQIFISPLEDKAETVLGILARELVHACLPDDEGYGPNFKAACKEIGLQGRARNMTPSLDLQKRLDEIADRLGDYPNSHIILAEKQKLEKPKKKTSFKLFCPHKRECDSKKCSLTDKAIGEDYTATVTAKKLELGFPLCPCSHELVMEEEDFKLYTDGRKEPE